MRFSPIALAAALLFAGAASSHAQDPTAVPAAVAPASGKVTVHATWDNAYVYFAFQVDDTDVVGTNARPLSHPEQDDSIGVYFQTGTDKPETPNTGTHAMLVSAAEGFTLLDGDPATGKLVVPAKPNFGIKYGVTVQGTLNHPDDRDRGYTITLAVPYSLLGLDPATIKPGMVIGFNAVVRSRAGALTSLAPAVKTEADVPDPAKWTRLTLLDSTGAGASTEGVSAVEVNTAATPPLIDGTYRTLDWPHSSELSFASPDKPSVKTVVPATPIGPKIDFATADSQAPGLDLSQPLTGLQHLLLARYKPAFQADRRKAGAPPRGVFAGDGTVLLPDQPATGLGPWFSSARIGYHRGELSEMRRDGVDVAVVQVGGPGVSDAVDDETSLLALVSALREMAATGQPAPQLALCVDIAKLSAGATKPDLAQASGRDALYAAIRRWTKLIPPEFRARVLVSPGAANGAIVAAYPVFLMHGEAIDGIADPDWTDTIRARFATDFGPATSGTTLLFAGFGNAWSAAGAKIAAVLPVASGAGTGAVSTAVIQPGKIGATDTVSRHDGATYHASWEAAITAGAVWTLIDSWNDFTDGSEVAASRQYGPKYLDATRIEAIQLSGLKPTQVRWLGEDAPRRMAPGQVVTTTVDVQNTGMSILRGEEGVRLVYRWLQNGAVVAEGPLKLPLTSPLLPTRSQAIPVGLVAASLDAEGHFAPLLPGDYVVEFDLAQVDADGKATLFSANGGSPSLRVPVTVSASLPDTAQFERTTTPTLLRTGANVPTVVRLRWLGVQPLAINDAAIVTQILSEDGKSVLLTDSTPLPTALPPGLWTNVPLVLHFSDAGTPLPPMMPDLRRAPGAPENVPGTYRIRYLLTRSNSVEPIGGAFEESVAVYPADDRAEVEVPAVPPTVFNAGARITLPVRIVNAGATKWMKSAFSVGYHWYDADGLETDWKPSYLTPIVGEVIPGGHADVTADVRTPDHEGDYVLAIDVHRADDGTFLSTLSGDRSASTGLIPIRVRTGDRLNFVDLSRTFNVDAVASDAKPTDGDLDGAGHTFPAESFPPDRFGIVGALSPEPLSKATNKASLDRSAYPSGYYVATESNQRQISFRYGSDADGAKNAISCASQTIPLPKGKFVGLHVVATVTGGRSTSAPLALTFHYKSGVDKIVAVNLPDWNATPGPADLVALDTSLERGPTGDTATRCTLYHAIYALDVSRDLVSVTLGSDPHIKIFAMTLEK